MTIQQAKDAVRFLVYSQDWEARPMVELAVGKVTDEQWEKLVCHAQLINGMLATDVDNEDWS